MPRPPYPLSHQQLTSNIRCANPICRAISDVHVRYLERRSAHAPLTRISENQIRTSEIDKWPRISEIRASAERERVARYVLGARRAHLSENQTCTSDIVLAREARSDRPLVRVSAVESMRCERAAASERSTLCVLRSTRVLFLFHLSQTSVSYFYLGRPCLKL
jgi:hypothetical protein